MGSQSVALKADRLREVGGGRGELVGEGRGGSIPGAVGGVGEGSGWGWGAA